MQKILITQSQLKNYSGSEIVTLELAEYFCAKGLDVTLLTHYLDDPVAQDLAKLSTVHVVVTGTKEANEIDVGVYDFIWVHHLTLTDKIIEQLATMSKKQRPKIVFHHMSASESLEFPTLLSAENELSDLILFNSLETRERVEAMGAIFPDEKVLIFGNPAPDSFFAKKMSTESKSPELRKIAVISNHPPRELREAAVILRRRGVNVDFIGRVAGGGPKRVTADTYSEYDAIVSIGKSVQYGIVNNTPVYCYDRFGGPGFLNQENYSLAMTRNFSGRGFDRKTSSQIADEVSGDAEKVFSDFHAIHKKHSDDFLLSKKIDSIVKKLEDTKERSEISDFSKNSFIFYSANINRFLPAYLQYNYRFKYIAEQYGMLTREKEELAQRNHQLSSQLKSLESGKLVRYSSYLRKIIQKILRPNQLLKSIVARLKRLSTVVHSPLEKRRKQKGLNDLGSKAEVFTLPSSKLTQLSYEELTHTLIDINDSEIKWKALEQEFNNSISRPTASVVVLVLNNIEMTTRCIESIMNTKNSTDFELIVVDNGSNAETLGGLGRLKDKYKEMKLIHNIQNLNFSLGNNIGFSHATGTYTVFINNDTYVTDGWLDAIIEPLHDKNIKAVQPTLLYPDDTVQCVGIVFSDKSQIGYGMYVNEPKDNKVVVKDRKLQAVTAACIAVRSNEFAHIKGFDPLFVNGQEDIDLCLRLTADEGSYCYCASKAIVYHDESKTPGRGKRVLLNRRVFLDRWAGKIIADDVKIYEEDGYEVVNWTVDSPEAIESGVEVYKPALRKVGRI